MKESMKFSRLAGLVALMLMLCLLLPGVARAEEQTCGEALTWAFDSDTGTLAISGTGDMDAYSDETPAPWAAFGEDITTLSLPVGITSIGDNAFAACTALTTVVFEGTETQKSAITVGAGNDVLYTAAWQYDEEPQAPTILTQPQNVTTVADNTATFSIEAEGATGYQWYYKSPAATKWTKITTATGSSYTFLSRSGNNGCLFYCDVSNDVGTVTSDTATLTVLSITTQPKNTAAKAGTTASFSVEASWATSFQWYYVAPGAASGTAIDGAINPAYSLTVTEADEGAGFYCVVGNDLGAVTSSTARLTLTMPPEIIKNPPNHSVKSGTRVAFTVEATGATTFQWYYKTRSSTAKWTAVSTSGIYTVNNDPDNSHSTLYFTASTTYNGYRYYCVVSNGSGSVDSTVGTLTVTAGGSTRTTSTRTATPRPAATAAATAGTNLVTPAPTPGPTPTPTPTATPTPSPTPIITTSPSPRATATPLPTMPPEPPDAGSVLPWVFAVLAAILLGWMYVMLRRAQEQLKQKQG